MADNQNRGSSDAFRRRQEARRRREPQTIDAKAQDVTTSPLSDPSEPGPQQSDPVSEAPLLAEASSAEAPDSLTPADRDATLVGQPVFPPPPEVSIEPDKVSETVDDRTPAAAFHGSVTDPVTAQETPDRIAHPDGVFDAAPNPDGVADTSRLSDLEHRADQPIAGMGEGHPPESLASGDAVPVSEFVRTPQSEEPGLAPHGSAEPVADGAHATETDAKPVEPGSPVPMSEFVRSPHGIEVAGPPGEDGHAADGSSVPRSASGDAEGAASGAMSFPDPSLSRERSNRLGDTSSVPPIANAERRQSFLPAGLAAVAVLIIASLAGIYYGMKLGGSAELAAKVDELSQRVATLEARPNAPTQSTEVGALQTRSTALDGDVAALKTSLADLTARLEQTTKAAAENSGRIATLEQHAAAVPNAPPSTAAENTPPATSAEQNPPSAEPSPPSTEPSPSPAVPAPATPPTIASPPETAGSGDAGTAPVAAASPPASPAAPPAAPASTEPASTEPASVNVDLAVLTGKVEDLAKRLAALPTEAPAPTDLAPLQGRISDLAARLEAQQAAVAALPKLDEARLDTRLTGLDQKVDQTGRQIAEVAQTVAAIPKLDLAPLQASIAEVDGRLKPVEAALAAPKSGDQVTDARAVGSIEESRAAPLAVVAGGIARALSDGRPFGPELDALHGLGIEDAALGPLPVLAGPGAPTAETLRDRWADIQTKVLTAAGPKTGDSVLDRFAAGARTLVQVRQVGTAPGDDPSAASSRIGAALDRGDIADALGEWAKLPEASRTASQSWADAARSRLEADASVQALMVRAIAALAPPKN